MLKKNTWYYDEFTPEDADGLFRRWSYFLTITKSIRVGEFSFTGISFLVNPESEELEIDGDDSGDSFVLSGTMRVASPENLKLLLTTIFSGELGLYEIEPLPDNF